MSRSSTTRSVLERVVDVAAGVARRAIPRTTRAGDALRRARHRLVRRPPSRPIEAVVDAYGAVNPTAQFVQVGSNDGVRFDPICGQVRTRRWTGIMIEPLPFLFERLKISFGHNRRLHLVNAAISDQPGTRPLYYLPEDLEPPADLPSWYDALGSFRRDVVLSHAEFIPDIEARIQSTEVNCLTFDAVCAQEGFIELDLIHIDTEGYDYEIIKQVDLDRWKPDVILYEHFHLSADDRDACRARLAAAGFDLVSDMMDTLAVQGSVLAAHRELSSAWTKALREAPSSLPPTS